MASNAYFVNMNKWLYCLLMSGLTHPLFSQDKVLLKDDFRNNKNKWELQKDTDFLVTINNGFLHLEKLQKNFDRRGCLWYSKAIPNLNTLRNFSITIYAKLLSSGDIFEMFDLQWGARDTSNHGNITDNLYQLSLTLKGYVKLEYFNSRWNFFVSKNPQTILKNIGYKPGDVNKYELVQKDGLVIFLVNDKELLRQLVEPIPGNSIGFQHCMKSAWELDKIIVRQLGNTETYSTERISAIAFHDGPAKADELKAYPNPFINTFYVNFQLEQDATVQLTLLDMNGAIIQQHNRKLLKGQQNINFYADVTPGTYIVKVQAGSTLKTTKIIKL
jgi:hypothetical protein